MGLVANVRSFRRKGIIAGVPTGKQGRDFGVGDLSDKTHIRILPQFEDALIFHPACQNDSPGGMFAGDGGHGLHVEPVVQRAHITDCRNAAGVIRTERRRGGDRLHRVAKQHALSAHATAFQDALLQALRREHNQVRAAKQRRFQIQ